MSASHVTGRTWRAFGPDAARWAALGLAVSTFALYWAVGGHAFLRWDDADYVSENPIVLNGLTWEGLRWAFSAVHSTNWHPLTTLSHMLDCQLFGPDPGWHHRVNAGLHALNATLCLTFFWRATRRPWASLFVACAFAWHPQRVESVAWISERKDLLSGVFFFVALLLYESQRSGRSRVGRRALPLIFLLGLLCKPSIVTLPLLLLILDRLPFSDAREPVPTRLPALREKVPLFVIALAAAAATWSVQRASGTTLGAEELTFLERAGNAVESYGRYVLQACVPLELSYFYPHPGLVDPDWTPWNGAFLASASVLAGVTWIAWNMRRSHPALLAGWLWFLLLLAPMIGFVQVGEHARADRYSYLSSIGLYALVAFGPLAALRGLGARARTVSAPLVLAVFCALTLREVGYWKDSETLFRRALVTTTRNYMAAAALGNVLRDSGRIGAAREQYTDALAIRPRNPTVLFNLGLLEQEAGRTQKAAELYRRALAIDPELVNAHLNLAAVRSAQGRLPEAVDSLGDVLRLAPRGSLAQVRARGNLLDLIKGLESHLEFSPGDSEALELRARALSALHGP